MNNKRWEWKNQIYTCLIVCNEKSSIIYPPRIDSCFFFYIIHQMVHVIQELNIRIVWTQPPNQSGSVPRRPLKNLICWYRNNFIDYYDVKTIIQTDNHIQDILPAVSLSFSRRTVLVTPNLAKWYMVWHPRLPPPMKNEIYN